MPQNGNAAPVGSGVAASSLAGGRCISTTPVRAAHHLADDLAEPMPAATPELWKLLGLIRRPLPLAQLRPAASAAGLTADELDGALAVAARRGAVRFAADRDGTVLAIAGRCR